MHDISLATDAEIVRKTLSNPQEKEKRYLWRSRLRWREPERIGVIFDRAIHSYPRYFLFTGSTEDKLMRADQERRQQEAKARYETKTIWQRIREELEKEPLGTPKPDRTLWKTQAMDTLASFHDKDYSTGAPFVDPLGVALQQRLGIGLGFAMEDHTRQLKDNEVPTTKRLQIRAVKSAIHRVNQIWTETNIERKRILTEVKDIWEQQEKLKLIVEKRNHEFEYLARRLTELIPMRASKGSPAVDDMILVPTKTIMAGGQEIQITDTTKSVSSVASRSVMKWYDVKSLNETKPVAEEQGAKNNMTNGTTTHNPPKDDEYYDYGADQDAYMEAWLKQKFSGGSSDGQDQNDDESGDPRTVLV